jgi:hypothetical protein
MTAPTQPKRRRWKRATDPLDLRHARRVLAREHAERMNAPQAPACRCRWPIHDGDGACLKCGKSTREGDQP